MLRRIDRRSTALLLVGSALTLLPASALAGPGGRPEAAAPAREAPSAAELKAHGNQKMVDADFVGAVEDYQKALALTPDDLGLHYNLGRAFGLLGNYPESLAELELFATRAPAELRARIAKFDDLLAETRQHVAYLTISCPVAGGTVQLGAAVVGQTPLTRRAVVAGRTTLRVTAEGYFDEEQGVSLEGGKESTLACGLSPKATTGTLVASVRVPGARLSVDGRFKGNERVELKLGAGAHVLSAEAEGYERATTSVVVDAGGSKSVDVPLHKKAVPLTSRWWFWGAVGAVVVAGAVVTVALVTEKPAGEGTIPPQRLGTPLTLAW